VTAWHTLESTGRRLVPDFTVGTNFHQAKELLFKGTSDNSGYELRGSIESKDGSKVGSWSCSDKVNDGVTFEFSDVPEREG